MKKYNLKVNLFLIATIILLLLNLLVLNITSKLFILAGLVIIGLVTLMIFKYRQGYYLEQRGVKFVFIIIGILQVVFYYLMGLFDGFSKNIVELNWSNFINILLPFAISICISELIRYTMLRENKDNKLVNYLVVIILILIDVNLYGGFSSNTFRDLSKLLEFCGLTLFPSIASNVVFNKITLNYGYKSIILYRLITIISYYAVPIVPNFNVLIRSVARIVVPILIYFQINYMYDRTSFEEVVKKDFREKSGVAIFFILATLFACLISCQFRYGLIAIGSNSMQKYLTIGDTILFEKYKKQTIDKGDIIIYNRDNRNIIHRVVEINVFNGENVYRTKGDNNDTIDKGYVYRKDIVGIVITRIKYIGYPSIWLKKAFQY